MLTIQEKRGRNGKLSYRHQNLGSASLLILTSAIYSFQSKNLPSKQPYFKQENYCFFQKQQHMNRIRLGLYKLELLEL